MPSPATPGPNNPLPVGGRPNWGYLIGLLVLVVLVLLIVYLVTTHKFGL
jgi:hypothetical protein